MYLSISISISFECGPMIILDPIYTIRRVFYMKDGDPMI